MRLLCCGRAASLSVVGTTLAMWSAGCGLDRSSIGEEKATMVDPSNGESDAGGLVLADAGGLDSGLPAELAGDGSTTGPGPANTCKLTGTLALRVDAQVSWKGSTLFDIVPIITPGVGGLSVLVLAELSEQNGQRSTTIRACNARTPDFSSSVGETYGVVIPDDVWERVAARWTAGVDFACSDPGCALHTTPITAQLGIGIAATTAWPTPRDPLDITTLRDDDSDGVPGILFRARGAKDPGSIRYTHPPTSYLLSERISDLMLALRIGAELDGQLDSCDALSGSVPHMTIDTRALACRLDLGDRCRDDQVGFIDDNLPVWQVGSARFKAVRVADSASCADARLALP